MVSFCVNVAGQKVEAHQKHIVRLVLDFSLWTERPPFSYCKTVSRHLDLP